jgi:hypothetical protein
MGSRRRRGRSRVRRRAVPEGIEQPPVRIATGLRGPPARTGTSTSAGADARETLRSGAGGAVHISRAGRIPARSYAGP